MSSEFATRLREMRETRGLTQAALGEAAKLPPTAISHFESGSRKPSFDNLRRLAKVLGVSTDYLMGLTDTADASGAAMRIARHLTQATEQEITMLETIARTMADQKSKP